MKLRLLTFSAGWIVFSVFISFLTGIRDTGESFLSAPFDFMFFLVFPGGLFIPLIIFAGMLLLENEKIKFQSPGWTMAYYGVAMPLVLLFYILYALSNID